MLNLHVIARTRNFGPTEVEGVTIFTNADEVLHFLLNAADYEKSPTVIVTVKRQGGQYKTYIFGWPAFTKYRAFGRTTVTAHGPTASTRLMFTDEYVERYDEDPDVIKA